MINALAVSIEAVVEIGFFGFVCHSPLGARLSAKLREAEGLRWREFGEISPRGFTGKSDL